MTSFYLGDMTPHGFCLLWEENLMAVTILADAFIALAYFAIPFQIYWASKNYNIRLPGWLLFLFGAFIGGCGISHVIDIVTLFYPFYWTQAIWLTATAGVSIITVFTMALGFGPAMARLNQRGSRGRENQP